MRRQHGMNCLGNGHRDDGLTDVGQCRKMLWLSWSADRRNQGHPMPARQVAKGFVDANQRATERRRGKPRREEHDVHGRTSPTERVGSAGSPAQNRVPLKSGSSRATFLSR